MNVNDGMASIIARNVNDALGHGLRLLERRHEAEPSRNGPVLVYPGPVMTQYDRPRERVLFSPKRNPNPFFHLMESLWMLGGRNDIAFPSYFNSQMKAYSDDGVTQAAAYGFRWLHHYGHNQIDLVCDELRAHPDSRRAVIGMWDAAYDLGRLAGGTSDLPCNTNCYFDLRGGALNVTVVCRSNDIWWGAYGANAVHFSMLLEYMATKLGKPVGVYRQFSNNYHLYTERVALKDMHDLADDAFDHDRYVDWEGSDVPPVEPFSLCAGDTDAWDADLKAFLKDPLWEGQYRDPFFNGTAALVYEAWDERKKHPGQGAGLATADDIIASDWKVACVEWIERADARAAAKAAS